MEITGNQDKSMEEYIIAWTKKPFQEEIVAEAAEVLRKFRLGETGLEIEAYTIPLEFGTGGIRGTIGPGVGRMNDYTVGRAALGFCRYLKTVKKNPQIVIAYDSRRKSIQFAEVTAGVAVSLGIKVKLFKEVTPTPLLSYAIRYFKADGGVVITASHNPPEYNGFKAYLADGGQLVAPADKKIIDAINKIHDWNEISVNGKKEKNYKKYVSVVEKIVFDTYISKVMSSGIWNKKLDPKDRKYKIVYSPLHGTGGRYMKVLLNNAGYKNVILVPEQSKPDGEFPTVKYPNPEEKDALVLCEKTAREKGAVVFIATDPDADRMGTGVLDSKGNYILLNGNQTGSIMSAYLCEKANLSGKAKDYFLFKTIVTTDLQEKIANANKVNIKNVLTGFKFIASEMGELDKKKDKKFLFGGEESYGYLPVNFVRDKDSLSSTLLFLEILSEKKDILAYMDEIYLKYGLYMESLKSISLAGEAGKNKIRESLDKLRKENLIGTSIGRRKIVSLFDYKLQESKGVGKKSVFNGLPKSDVIQLELEGSAKMTIRPSGTEPKVKVYSSFCYQNRLTQRSELESAKESLLAEIREAELIFIQMAGLG